MYSVSARCSRSRGPSTTATVVEPLPALSSPKGSATKAGSPGPAAWGLVGMTGTAPRTARARTASTLFHLVLILGLRVTAWQECCGAATDSTDANLTKQSKDCG